MALYQSYQKKWWKGRSDGKRIEEKRWHQIVKPFEFGSLIETGFAILGFSSDEGVSRNNGRVGAVGGPEAIQKAMCNLPVHNAITLFDAGNVLCDNQDLEAAQKLLGQKVSEILKTGCVPVVLGGGHEISWGHFQGLIRAFPDDNIGIINIDAHFDLRDAEVSTSGTPFRQIYNFQENRNGAFHYLVLGIQKHSNTKALFETADRLNVNYYYDSDFHMMHLPILEQAIMDLADKVDKLYLSIDMDAFNVSHAPGVSAVNIRGISPDEVTLRVLKTIAQTGKLHSIDIAEVNPKFDQDGRTAKLAAYLAYELVGELSKHH